MTKKWSTVLVKKQTYTFDNFLDFTALFIKNVQPVRLIEPILITETQEYKVPMKQVLTF